MLSVTLRCHFRVTHVLPLFSELFFGSLEDGLQLLLGEDMQPAFDG
jgi:hypothetical protein